MPNWRDKLQIADLVVRAAAITVVDVVARRDRTVRLLPDPPMLVDLAPVDVGGDVTVGSGPPAHTSSPCRRSDRFVQPCKDNTGCCAVPVSSALPENRTRPTSLKRRPAPVTRRGPHRVSTKLPTDRDSMGNAPAGVSTIVPAMKHQAAPCWGPFSRSGSSDEYSVAIAPLGHVTRRFDGSYFGMSHGGLTARMPDSPSTIVSRASAAVGATRAMRPTLSFCSRTHSAPTRVLPQPRPVMVIQIGHSPGGVCCFGRAQNDHSYRSVAASASVYVGWSSGGSVAMRSARDVSMSDRSVTMRLILPLHVIRDRDVYERLTTRPQVDEQLLTGRAQEEIMVTERTVRDSRRHVRAAPRAQRQGGHGSPRCIAHSVRPQRQHGAGQCACRYLLRRCRPSA